MAESNISKQVRLNEILITFIIPCYNSQETISRCLESILVNQSKNIEIICVDDFSTDKTAEIIDSHMNQDERIQYFKKSKHTNAGDTRNIGINMASGVYCWFVDSDDFVSIRSIDILIGIIKKYSYPNLIIFPYKIITENGYKYSIEKERQSTKNKITAINDENVDSYFQITTPEVWNKLFKLTLIKDNGVKFQSIKLTNDLFFTRALMSITDRYLMLDDYLYFHDTTNKQCISAKRGDFFSHIYCANIRLRAFLIEQNIYKKYKKTYLVSFMRNLDYERKCTSKIIYKALHTTAIFFIGILVRC